MCSPFGIESLLHHVAGPCARQHQVAYAGWFANVLGNLNDPSEEPKPEQQAERKKSNTAKCRPAAGKTGTPPDPVLLPH